MGILKSRNPMFDPRRQCCWCGSANFRTVTGYAGERQCLTCGWGGDGEPDVPCMFYKLIRRTEREGQVDE
jgi:hypothetical protein